VIKELLIKRLLRVRSKQISTLKKINQKQCKETESYQSKCQIQDRDIKDPWERYKQLFVIAENAINSSCMVYDKYKSTKATSDNALPAHSDDKAVGLQGGAVPATTPAPETTAQTAAVNEKTPKINRHLSSFPINTPPTQAPGSSSSIDNEQVPAAVSKGNTTNAPSFNAPPAHSKVRKEQEEVQKKVFISPAPAVSEAPASVPAVTQSVLERVKMWDKKVKEQAPQRQ
jgi:hypothetical protein